MIQLPPNSSGTVLDTVTTASRDREVHIDGGHLLTRASGTITAASGFGAGSAQGSTTVPAANSTVVLTPTGTDALGATVALDGASWTVQVTGTFVGTMTVELTLDGTTWVPVNSRQSAGGRLANSFTAPGLFRGVFGGLAAVRVRSTSWTSGTATVTVSIGDAAAVFSNSDLVVQGEAQYYASSAGLNSMYGATSDLLTFTVGPTNQAFFTLYNAAAVGGAVLYLYRISLGAGTSGATVRRRRFTGAPTNGLGNTAVAIDNRAGVANTPVATCFAGVNAITIPGTATLQKTVSLNNGLQDTSTEDLSLLVPPGQGLAFYVTAANGGTASAEVVWSEGSTLT